MWIVPVSSPISGLCKICCRSGLLWMCTLCYCRTHLQRGNRWRNCAHSTGQEIVGTDLVIIVVQTKIIQPDVDRSHVFSALGPLQDSLPYRAALDVHPLLLSHSPPAGK